MAIVSGPLLSETAHGQLGKALSFLKRKEAQTTRNFHYPHRNISLSQRTQREIIGILTVYWHDMGTVERQEWEDAAKASGLNIPTFNYWIKTAQTDLATHRGIVAFWSMNEASGATITDHSGEGNNGTLKPTYPTNVPYRANSINDKFGKALSFNGINNYVSVPHSSSLSPTQEVAVEMWVYIRAVTGIKSLLTKTITDDWSNGYGMYFTSSYIYFWVNLYNAYRARTTIELNKWIHILGHYDRIAVRIYKNGVPGVLYNYTTAIITNTAPVIIGAGNYDFPGVSFYANCMIDSLRIYKRAISPQETQRLYELLRNPNRRQLKLK